MSYWAQGQGLEKRCKGVWSDSPEMRSSTAVSFLLAFAGENLAPVKPVVRPSSSEGGTCVKGPKHTQAQTPAGPGSKGSPPLPHTAHCSLWVLPVGHGLGNITVLANSTNRLALGGGSVSGTADAVPDLFLASATRLTPSSAELAQGQIKESQFPFSSNQFLLGQTKPRVQCSCPPVILWFAMAGRGSFGKPEPISCSACCSVYPRLSPGNALMDIIRPGKHLELLSSVRAAQTAKG